MVTAFALTLLLYQQELRHVPQPASRLLHDKRTTAQSITVDPRNGRRNKSTNSTKKPFRHATERSVSVSAGQPRVNTTWTSQLVRNITDRRNEAGSQDSITILFWTYLTGGNVKRQCNTAVPCVYTYDHSLYNVSDVVILTSRLIRDRQQMPSFRPPHQHWITFLREAPDRTALKIKPYETWFNWTIAYSMNSDVVLPYGMCLPTRDKVAKDPSSITDLIRRVYGKSAESMPWVKRNLPYTPYDHAKGKTRLVLWFVSNCHPPSLRERYVAELKQYVDIDIFGKCTCKTCKRNSAPTGDLYKTHKFYLAFENSLCADYITEKVWTRLQQGILPIVLGGADYKTHLPPHSYIDVKDYSSPKQLAKYLHQLDKNDTLYNEYFAWKQNYTCQQGFPGLSSFCEICRMMNENRNKVNIIPDINKHFAVDCMLPKEYYKGFASDILRRKVSNEAGSKWPSYS